MSKNPKIDKIVNIVEENLHLFRMSSGIPMKFSGKMSLMMLLRVTKNQDSTLSLKNMFSEKSKGGLPALPRQPF